MNQASREDLLDALAWDTEPDALPHALALDLEAELSVLVEAAGQGFDFDGSDLFRVLGSLERRAKLLAKLLSPPLVGADEEGDAAES